MKPKILVIGSVSNTGGVSRYLIDLEKYISNFEVVIFDISHQVKKNIEFEEARYSTAINAGFKRFLLGLFTMLSNMIRFPFVVKKVQPEIIHVTGLSYSRFWERAYYLLVAKISNKSVFYHYLGALDLFYQSSNSFSKYLINTFIDMAHHISFLSLRVKNLMCQNINTNKGIR